MDPLPPHVPVEDLITESGTYTNTYISSWDCDSLVTVTLIIHSTPSASSNETAVSTFFLPLYRNTYT